VQVALDENVLNYVLLTMFYDEKPFSLTKKLADSMPPSLEGAGAAMRALMNTQVFSILMPELQKEYGNAPVDLRCAMNQKLLHDGKLPEEEEHLAAELTTFKFREGNKIDADLHFGCSVVVYKDGDKKSGSIFDGGLPSSFGDVMSMVGNLGKEIDYDDPKWVKHRSFFMSASVNVELDLSEKAKSPSTLHEDFYEAKKASRELAYVFGKLKKFNPTIKQLKVYKKDKEERDEAKQINKRI
jgi:hypothetical protein